MDYATVNDEGALRKVVEEVIANNPKAIEDFRGGKEKATWRIGWTDHESNEARQIRHP